MRGPGHVPEDLREDTVLVCHCRVVNDHAIRAAISAGARGVGDIGALCGAGTECGGCVPSVEALLAEAAVAVHAPERMAERQRQRRRAPALAPS